MVTFTSLINILAAGKQILSSISIFSVKMAYSNQYVNLSWHHSACAQISQQYRY